MEKLIDSRIDKGVQTDIIVERNGTNSGKVYVKDTQDIAPTIKSNEFFRHNSRTDSKRGEGRVIADVPRAIYLQWINTYGFDMLSYKKSNWGIGMTPQEHKKFLRGLLNANPALKTVDESL